MKINKINDYYISVPVKFGMAKGVVRYSHHIIIEIFLNEYKGIGSSLPYKTNIHYAYKFIKKTVIPYLYSTTFLDIKKLRESIQIYLGIYPGILFAFDSALWDIEAKMKKKRVCELLYNDLKENILITEQICIDTWLNNKIELNKMISNGTQCIKIKLGSNPKDDIERVKNIRDYVGSKMELKVDFNHAYDFHESLKVSREIKKYGVSLLEEPLKFQDINQLKTFKTLIGIPVMLDEHIMNLEQLKRAIKHDAIDVLNIKLTRVGGITQAVNYVDLCKKKGIKLSIGCSEDLGAGMSSILHLASGINNIVGVEGVGSNRLGFDYVSNKFNINNGFVNIPQNNGLGVTLEEEELYRLSLNGEFILWLGDNMNVWEKLVMKYIVYKIKIAKLMGIIIRLEFHQLVRILLRKIMKINYE